MKRWMACGDTHGDMIEPKLRDAALRFRDKFKPHYRIDGGDVFDMRSLRKGASAEERAESVQLDVEAGESWIRDYQPTQLLWGNHDARLWEAKEKCGDANLKMLYNMLADRISDYVASVGCKAFPYDFERGVFKLADTSFIHGYHHNMHAAYKAGQVYGNVIMFHVHQFARVSIERSDGSVAESCGCMAKKDMGYNRRRTGTFRWDQGFKYGYIQDGKLISLDAKWINGKLYTGGTL